MINGLLFWLILLMVFYVAYALGARWATIAAMRGCQTSKTDQVGHTSRGVGD